MRPNQWSILSSNDPVVILGQHVNIADDYKYLGSKGRSTENDVKVWIGLELTEFAKV